MRAAENPPYEFTVRKDGVESTMDTKQFTVNFYDENGDLLRRTPTGSELVGGVDVVVDSAPEFRA